MAKHEIAIHENTGTTKDKAPYLGSYITKGTVGTEGFVSALAAKCGLPTIQVQAILSGCIEAIEALEREELVRIHLDGFTVMGAITGTFDTSDAAFDPERNAFNLVLTPEPEIRNAVIDVQPTIVTDASLTRLRVDNVADLGSPRPYNTVHGQSKFRVAGFNMSLSDEGAGAHFEGEGGAVYPLVVDEVVSKQLFVAHTAALLEAGEYKLVVKSRAGDAEGPLQTAFRKVKYLKVVAPKPKVTARELKVIKTPVDTEYNIYGIENVEAIKGYQETEYGRSFDAKISVNGGEWFNEYFNFMEGTPNQAVITNLQGAIGDNVRVMLEVDPEKTEYDPTPCILEATVVAQ